ncbi:hypothetical protein ZIOFF_054597 [Zingiber officinale]|uniref:EG45-like domain containing protein n=1 Tax=Zingiber officinale TaxID=94328 RepID=A0A8J5FEN7_ZINOF|nr:hypothetical protein ZIOFF_054597 [Zingiber officinale]
MASTKSSMVVAAMVMVALVSSVAAVPGIATFYTPPYTPSSCFGFQDRGVLIAAAGDSIWGNRAACGRRYTVSCTGGTNAVPNPCRVAASLSPSWTIARVAQAEVSPWTSLRKLLR